MRGLSYLTEHMFIASARHIKVINPAGVDKMKRNILSLQQCLRGLSKSQNDVLARAMTYWDLYAAGPKVSRRHMTHRDSPSLDTSGYRLIGRAHVSALKDSWITLWTTGNGQCQTASGPNYYSHR